MPFVLDNSVLCGWMLGDQADAYTDAVAQRLIDDVAVAPQLLRLEFVNVLRTACKRERIPIEAASEIIDHINALPIQYDSASSEPAQIMQLSLRFNLSSYDAAYLDLALRRQLPVATRDADLADAARAAGVGLFKP
jgi:predicted nucleic acid-binding protein